MKEKENVHVKYPVYVALHHLENGMKKSAYIEWALKCGITKSAANNNWKQAREVYNRKKKGEILDVHPSF